MNSKTKRSPEPGRKKGPDRNEPAVKHDKVHETHPRDTDKDIHEDRGIRKQKLGKRR